MVCGQLVVHTPCALYTRMYVRARTASGEQLIWTQSDAVGPMKDPLN